MGWKNIEGMVMNIELKILDNEFYKKYPLPKYATIGSAAVDIRSTQDLVIMPQERVMIGTGLAIWVGSNGYPICNSFFEGVAGVIIPRSGLGTKGLVLANTVGLIDEDYQGELTVSAWNSLEGRKAQLITNDENGVELIKPFMQQKGIIKIKAGDRIAQLMFIPVIKASWEIVEEFSDKTQRAEGGFGHSGV